MAGEGRGATEANQAHGDSLGCRGTHIALVDEVVDNGGYRWRHRRGYYHKCVGGVSFTEDDGITSDKSGYRIPEPETMF